MTRGWHRWAVVLNCGGRACISAHVHATCLAEADVRAVGTAAPDAPSGTGGGPCRKASGWTLHPVLLLSDRPRKAPRSSRSVFLAVSSGQ